MKNLLFIISILYFTCFSCGGYDFNLKKTSDIQSQYKRNDSVYVKSYYDNGNVKECGWKKGEMKTDWWFYLYKNGVISKKEKYNELCSLIWKIEYDSIGTIIFEGYYNGQKKNGYSKYYFPNGKMSKEGWYRNDEQAGWWKDYNEKGELLFEGNYEHSVKNGYFKYYS